MDTTFTYPLRSSPREMQDFQRTLRRVMESSTRSLGSNFRPKDKIGIYNESRAARITVGNLGEVCLVGDLGGGTLDIFLSAEPGPGIEFEEVADSAKLGGNALLRTMAEHAGQFLPEGWGNSEDAQIRLRTWMRSRGAASLLGYGDGNAERHPGLEVTGFSKPGDAKATRALIGRYFRLVVEYMARSLVAYLVRHWHPRMRERGTGDHGKLRVKVALRGNGWRLWPDTASYAEINQKIATVVAGRARELWQDPTGDRDPWCGSLPIYDAPRCSSGQSSHENPKVAPILRAVGEAQRHEEIRTFSHVLVQLEIQRMPGDEGSRRIRWFDRMPVEIGGDGAVVEFDKIEPPFTLMRPGSPLRCLDDIEDDLKREIKQDIKDWESSESDFKAPVASFVWERVFRSKRFVKGE